MLITSPQAHLHLGEYQLPLVGQVGHILWREDWYYTGGRTLSLCALQEQVWKFRFRGRRAQLQDERSAFYGGAEADRVGVEQDYPRAQNEL